MARPSLAVVEPATVRQDAIYVALSKDDRKSGRVMVDYDSADAQLDRLREACRAAGVRRPEVYLERDVSGERGRGVERARLLQDCAAGRIRRIWMTRFDRFTRDVVEALTLPQQLADWGVEICTIEEPGLYDMADDSKALYRDLKAVLNKNECRASSARRKEKFRARATIAGLHNATAPAGYFKRDGKLVPSKKLAPAVRLIFNTYAEGACVAHVLDRLREQFTDLPFFSRNRVEWVLHNRVYCGKVQYKGEWYDGAHRALVSEELFERCQVLLNTVKETGRKFDRFDGDVYPLAGYVWCSATRIAPDRYERMLCSATHKRRKDGTVNKIRAYRRASTEDKVRRAGLELLGAEVPQFGGLNAKTTELVVAGLVDAIARSDERWAAVVAWTAEQCAAVRGVLAERVAVLEQERKDWLEECDAVDQQLRLARREGSLSGALARRLDGQLGEAEERLAWIEARLADCEQLVQWYATLPGEVQGARAGWRRVGDYYSRGLLRPLQGALRNILQAPYGVLVDHEGRITLQTRLSARLDELAGRFAKIEILCIRPSFTANLLGGAMHRLAA